MVQRNLIKNELSTILQRQPANAQRCVPPYNCTPIKLSADLTWRFASPLSGLSLAHTFSPVSPGTRGGPLRSAYQCHNSENS